MFTESVVLSLYFETPLHAGAGGTLGAIDLPVVRERTTQWPVIHASTVKGALRAAMAKAAAEDLVKLFGKEDTDSAGQAAALSVGDARLLLFPVRSSVAPFLWLTCPAALSRLKRDLARTVGVELPALPNPKADEIVYGSAWKHGDDAVAVEDVVLKPKSGLNAAALLSLIPSSGGGYDGFPSEVESSLGIVSDEVFGFLVRTTTEVQPRIRLDAKTGTVTGKDGGVFYEELVPADCLFYVPIVSTRHRSVDGSALGVLEKNLSSHVQVGGDESLGRGWARGSLLKAKAGAQ